MRKGISYNERYIFGVVLIFCTTLNLFGQKFEFKDNKGDKYRIISTTIEEVYLITDNNLRKNTAGNNRDINKNGNVYEMRKLLQTSRTVDRMAAEVLESQNGSALIKAVFNVAEESTSSEDKKTLQWSEEYDSVFRRSKRGKITIEKKYFMPSIRDVPYFPAEEIVIGQTWVTKGDEVLDLRKNFEIMAPYSIPFNASNKYLGGRVRNGKTYKVFQVNWNINKKEEPYFEDVPNTYMLNKYRNYSESVPEAKSKIKAVSGKAEAFLYWDEKLSQIAYDEDEFSLEFELSDGRKYLFHGKTQSELIAAEVFNKDTVVEAVREDLKELGVKDTDVRIVDKGVAISMENIQFEADSAVLPRSEKDKLDKIALILQKYNDRDIIVEGHTALAGTVESRMELSRERAESVASYLIQNKVRSRDRIIIKAAGSTKPIADNSTEAGKKKNRRVEIVIMEN